MLKDIRIPQRATTSNVERMIEMLGVLRNESHIPTRRQSEVSGVSLSAYHNWIHGLHEPTLRAFDRSLNALGYRLAIVKQD